MAIHGKLTAEEARALGMDSYVGSAGEHKTVLRRGKLNQHSGLNDFGEGVFSGISGTNIGHTDISERKTSDPFGADAHWIEIEKPDKQGNQTIRVLFQTKPDRVVVDSGRSGLISPILNIVLPQQEAGELISLLKNNPELAMNIMVAQYRSDNISTLLSGIKATGGKYRMIETDQETLDEIRNARREDKKEVLEKNSQVYRSPRVQSAPTAPGSGTAPSPEPAVVPPPEPESKKPPKERRGTASQQRREPEPEEPPPYEGEVIDVETVVEEPLTETELERLKREVAKLEQEQSDVGASEDNWRKYGQLGEEIKEKKGRIRELEAQEAETASAKEQEPEPSSGKLGEPEFVKAEPVYFPKPQGEGQPKPVTQEGQGDTDELERLKGEKDKAFKEWYENTDLFSDDPEAKARSDELLSRYQELEAAVLDKMFPARKDETEAVPPPKSEPAPLPESEIPTPSLSELEAERDRLREEFLGMDPSTEDGKERERFQYVSRRLEELRSQIFDLTPPPELPTREPEPEASLPPAEPPVGEVAEEKTPDKLGDEDTSEDDFYESHLAWEELLSDGETVSQAEPEEVVEPVPVAEEPPVAEVGETSAEVTLPAGGPGEEAAESERRRSALDRLRARANALKQKVQEGAEEFERRFRGS